MRVKGSVSVSGVALRWRHSAGGALIVLSLSLAKFTSDRIGSVFNEISFVKLRPESSSAGGERITLSTTHVFSNPGTYFPALRATSQRNGDSKTPYARIDNLARVRVVVH